MDTKYIRNSFRLLYGMLLLTVIYSCANIGSPNGGPYDETPPKFVSSTPVPNQINYTGKKIEILFDELIQIEKPSENVIITPPQMELPVIRSAGKKAVIELKDTLKPNTTYTIDFTNSISDNNEKNVFENFSFAFSTGDIIDTLEVSGVLAECRESRTDARHYDRPAQQFGRFRIRETPGSSVLPVRMTKGSSRFVISLLEPIIFLP